MRLEDKHLECIARLSTNHDFKVFMEALIRKHYLEALERCIEEDKPARFQGRVQALDEIIKVVDGAIETHRQRSRVLPNMGQSL